MVRGYTLIELMVSLAILSVGVSVPLMNFNMYQKASQRAFEVEGLARILDAEMERARACPTAKCLLALRTQSPVSVESPGETWVRAKVSRQVKRTQRNLFKVTIEAQVPGRLGPQQMQALLFGEER